MRLSPNSMNIKHSHTGKNRSEPREVTLVLIQEETIPLTLPPPPARASHPLLQWFGYSTQMLMSNNSLMLMIRTLFGSKSNPTKLETWRIPKWFKRDSVSQRCHFRANLTENSFLLLLTPALCRGHYPNYRYIILSHEMQGISSTRSSAITSLTLPHKALKTKINTPYLTERWGNL